MKDSMGDALKRKKHSGVNITLIIGEPKDEPKDGGNSKEDQELAPEVKDTGGPLADQGDAALANNPAHPDEALDQEMIRKMLGEATEGGGGSTLASKAHSLMKSKLKK